MKIFIFSLSSRLMLLFNYRVINKVNIWDTSTHYKATSCRQQEKIFTRQSYYVWSARRLFNVQKLRETWIEFSWIADNSQLRSCTVKENFLFHASRNERWFRRCWRVGARARIEGALRLLRAWLRSRRSEALFRRGETRDSIGKREIKGAREGGRNTRWDRRRATSRAQRHWRRARQPQRDPLHAHLSPLRPYSRAPYTSCTTATYPTRPPGSDIVSGHVTHHRRYARPDGRCPLEGLLYSAPSTRALLSLYSLPVMPFRAL